MTPSRWAWYVIILGGVGLLFGLWNYLDPLPQGSGGSLVCLGIPSLEHCGEFLNTGLGIDWKIVARYSTWVVLPLVAAPVLLQCFICGGFSALCRRYGRSLQMIFRYQVRHYGFRAPDVPGHLTLAVTSAGLVALFGIAVGYGALFGGEREGNTDAIQLMAADSPVFYLVFLIFAVALTPLWEEYFFRGVLPSVLQRGIGLPRFVFCFRNRYSVNGMVAIPPVPWWLASCLSAALFAAAHLTLDIFAPLMAAGLLLTAVRYLTGSLWPCVALHAAHNLLAMVVIRGGF